MFRLECLALWEVIGFTSAAMHVALHGEEQTTEGPLERKSTILSKMPAVKLYSVSEELNVAGNR